MEPAELREKRRKPDAARSVSEPTRKESVELFESPEAPGDGRWVKVPVDMRLEESKRGQYSAYIRMGFSHEEAKEAAGLDQ